MTVAATILLLVVPWGTVTAAILGVFACSALLGWGTWRVYRSTERAERDPRYFRRRLIIGGSLYLACSTYGIVQVAMGKQPAQSLIGLPIGLLIAWVFLRTAIRVNVPPR
jgi:hypothetical protein